MRMFSYRRYFKALVTLLAFASFSRREVQAQETACEHPECLRVCFTEYEPFIFKNPADKPGMDKDGQGGPLPGSTDAASSELTLLQFYEEYAGFDVELIAALALTQMGVTVKPTDGELGMVFSKQESYAASLYYTRIGHCQMAIGAYVKSVALESCGCEELGEGEAILRKHVCCLDFSTPYLWDGFTAIMKLEKNAKTFWEGLEETIFNVELLTAFSWLTLFLITSGHLIWLAERKYNPKMFPQNYLDGVDDGLWWSVATMTTVGYGDKVPITMTGRFIGVIWMFFGLMLFGFFSTIMSSISVNMTIEAMMKAPSVTGVNDLRSHTPICTLNNSAADFLGENRLAGSALRVIDGSININDCYELLEDDKVNAVFGERIRSVSDVYKGSPAWKSILGDVDVGLTVSPILQHIRYAIVLQKDSLLGNRPLRTVVDEGLKRIQEEAVFSPELPMLYRGWAVTRAEMKYFREDQDPLQPISVETKDDESDDHSASEYGIIIFTCIVTVVYLVVQIGGLYLRLWRQKRRILAGKSHMPSGGLQFPTVNPERSETKHDLAAAAYEVEMHEFKEDVMNEMREMMEKYISDSGARYSRAAKITAAESSPDEVVKLRGGDPETGMLAVSYRDLNNPTSPTPPPRPNRLRSGEVNYSQILPGRLESMAQ